MSNQTGPRAEEGKKASSQNNRRHGLSTANVIVSPAERPLFDQLEAELRDEIDIEGLAIRRLVTATWQMENCRQKEATLDQNPERERRVADTRTTPTNPTKSTTCETKSDQNPERERRVADPRTTPTNPTKSTTCETKPDRNPERQRWVADPRTTPRHSRQINNLRDEIPHPRPALAHISGGANFAPTQSSRLSR